VKKQRALASPNLATFRQLWDALGLKLIESTSEHMLHTQEVTGSSPVPPTTASILAAGTALSLKKGTCFAEFGYLPAALGCARLKAD
jgi:hypothetical protein